MVDLRMVCFYSTEEKAQGFSFLVDLRLASWAAIKPVIKLIQVHSMFATSYTFPCKNPFVINPPLFTDSLLTADTQVMWMMCQSSLQLNKFRFQNNENMH